MVKSTLQVSVFRLRTQITGWIIKRMPGEAGGVTGVVAVGAGSADNAGAGIIERVIENRVIKIVSSVLCDKFISRIYT